MDGLGEEASAILQRFSISGTGGAKDGYIGFDDGFIVDIPPKQVVSRFRL